MFPSVRPLAVVLSLLALPLSAFAGGPFGIDHTVAYDNSGIWNRSYQKDLAVGTAAAVLGGALFIDSDTRLGRTFDQSLDAIVLGGITTSVMKYTFSRARPNQTDNPNEFFAHKGHQSFPSGEVAEISAAVTPFIAEYGQDHPAVYALAALPIYDAVARVKTHGHWQSDVLVGAAIGVGFGIYAHRRKSPLVMGLLPGGGAMLSYRKEF